MAKTLSNLLFLCHATWIICGEVFLYLLFRTHVLIFSTSKCSPKLNFFCRDRSLFVLFVTLFRKMYLCHTKKNPTTPRSDCLHPPPP